MTATTKEKEPEVSTSKDGKLVCSFITSFILTFKKKHGNFVFKFNFLRTELVMVFD